ncbi:MAG TPA: hypothetical protein VGJ79_08770 [Candidatus Dormibacteraeota bacterium]
MTLARRVEWELLGLIALLIVLVVLGVVVARAAGIALPGPLAQPGRTAPVAPIASPAAGTGTLAHGIASPAQVSAGHATASPTH